MGQAKKKRLLYRCQFFPVQRKVGIVIKKTFKPVQKPVDKLKPLVSSSNKIDVVQP